MVSRSGSTEAAVRYPSNADADNVTSVAIARRIFGQIEKRVPSGSRLAGQASGSKFEQLTRAFLEETFLCLKRLRPGAWNLNPGRKVISSFEQYKHLADLAALTREAPTIAASLGNDYVITPDVVVVREPEPDEVINSDHYLVDESIAVYSPLRARNGGLPLLHASISCKWTLRSDRAQNARSEALNLIRNRKGRAPHIAVVTAEPLPSRLASLALGTGDLDCVYHFALPELLLAVDSARQDEASNLMRIMVDGKRLKDIADLPLDLAI